MHPRPGLPARAGEALPLLHVMSPESRRGIHAAVASHACRSRDGRLLTASLVPAPASAALVRDPVTFSMLAVMGAIFTLVVVGPALAVRSMS